MKLRLANILCLCLLLAACSFPRQTQTPEPKSDPLSTPWEDFSIFKDGLRSELDDDGDFETGRARKQMCAALRAELACHAIRQIGALKILHLALGDREAGGGHGDHHEIATAGYVLAFAAKALRPHDRLALGAVANAPSITTAVDFHYGLP